MGFIYQNFALSVLELWEKASKVNNKNIHSDLTWTFGIMNGNSHDFLDLQVHALALASSIILTERVVPKIICCWDIPYSYSSLKKDSEKEKYYPSFLFEAFKVPHKDFFHKEFRRCYRLSSKYFDLHRSSLSVNGFPYKIGIGYRAKYLALNYVQTPYGIMTDADTICLRPTIEYLMQEVNKNPDSFCWSAFWDEVKNQLNVGLNIYNMNLYRNLYLPKMNENYWNLPRGDVYFLGSVFHKYPELKNKLKIQLLDYELISVGKFKPYVMAGNKTTFNTERSMHYHGWKEEYRSNPTGFIKTFNEILDNLKEIR